MKVTTLIVQAVVKQEYPGAVVTASTSSSTPTSARRKPRNPIPVERKVAQNWLDQFPISEVLVLCICWRQNRCWLRLYIPIVAPLSIGAWPCFSRIDGRHIVQHCCRTTSTGSVAWRTTWRRSGRGRRSARRRINSPCARSSSRGSNGTSRE